MQISALNTLIAAQQARQAMPSRAAGTAPKPDQAPSALTDREFLPLSFESKGAPVAAPSSSAPSSSAPPGSQIDIRV